MELPILALNHCVDSLDQPFPKFKRPVLCDESLRLPSSKFEKPMLTLNHWPAILQVLRDQYFQVNRLPLSKFKRSILCTQSLRLPLSKFKRTRGVDVSERQELDHSTGVED